MGFGDLHETRFDYLEQAAWFHQLNTFSVRKSDYTGVPLNEETCSTLLRIFPSSTFEENHVTNQPIVFTVVAILTFALIAVVFCVYDLYVRRRQKLVLDSAERTTAIVDSFFPAGVRERLFATEDSVKNDLGFKWSSKTKDAIGGSPADGLAITHPSKQAIADVFSDTTVFFGDIASFTSWSSERDPSQVFVLLETLYASFDGIAKRMKVFKVETVSKFMALGPMQRFGRQACLLYGCFTLPEISFLMHCLLVSSTTDW